LFSKKSKSIQPTRLNEAEVTNTTVANQPTEEPVIIKQLAESPGIVFVDLKESNTEILAKRSDTAPKKFRQDFKISPKSFLPIGAGLKIMSNKEAPTYPPRRGYGSSWPALASLGLLMLTLTLWTLSLAVDGSLILSVLGLGTLIASLILASRGTREKLRLLATVVFIIDLLQLFLFIVGLVMAVSGNYP